MSGLFRKAWTVLMLFACGLNIFFAFYDTNPRTVAFGILGGWLIGTYMEHWFGGWERRA